MRTFGRLRTVLATLVCVTLATTGITAVSLSTETTQAQAATVGFNPGNIIDDALFYDGSAMTAAEIQTFLKDRVPRCTLGDKGREVGKSVRWSGINTKLAAKCLRDYKMKTTSQAANSYCKAYSGSASESAASIIAKISKACGVSPRVLLITLEKEQSLISDSWPNELQYFRAMGYGCPDSGPGNTANCDATQGGFYKQVYRAAWQLKVYRAFPNSYTIKPFTTNNIQYHPNKNCGTKKVYVANYATAALYVYTPYTPNDKALAAGWGTGDSCSSYGNRNFYNFWRSWFGSVRAAEQLTGKIKQVYDAAAKAGTPYGAPTSARERITANGGGYQMQFEKGIITESTKLGKAFGTTDTNLVRAYVAAGGAQGSWGFMAANPSGSKAAGRDNRIMPMQNGTVIHSDLNAAVGIRFIPTVVYKAWTTRGGAKGALGFPNANPTIYSSTASSQRFIGGTIMAAAGKHTVVSASDVNRWQSLGGFNKVGLFTADVVKHGAQTSRDTHLGTVYFTSSSRHVFLPNGPLRTAYVAAKGPRCSWGWPSGGAKNIAGGSSLAFSNGVAVYNAANKKTVFQTAAAYANWQKRGGGKSGLGFPTTSTRTVKGGSYQLYQKHAIFYGSKTVLLKRDAILKTYLAKSGPAGAWGWPVASPKAIKGGTRMQFTKGYAIVNAATKKTVFVSTTSHRDWNKRGGTKAAIGFPVANTASASTGSSQQYKKHYVFFGPKKTVLLPKGAATKAYFASGGPRKSKWGWPIGTPKKTANGATTIAFTNGTLTQSRTGKTSFKTKPKKTAVTVKKATPTGVSSPTAPTAPTPSTPPQSPSGASNDEFATTQIAGDTALTS